MLVLSLDTTTRQSSCALLRDGVVVCESVGDPSGAHATRLPGDLMALLAQAGVTVAEIDVCAVTTGPGSFTGLRIGIATMQGLAFAARKPLVGVSGFDALAMLGGEVLAQALEPRSAQSVRVATWVDAWRGEVFAALYEDGVEIEPPAVTSPELLLRGLAGRPTLFLGDGAASFRERILQAMPGEARFAEPVAPSLASAVARIAAVQTVLPPPHEIRPLYVRRPDAELLRERPV